MERMGVFTDLKTEIPIEITGGNHFAPASRLGTGLQDSPITGQRYLTSKTRRADQARRDRDEFMKELDAMRKNT